LTSKSIRIRKFQAAIQEFIMSEDTLNQLVTLANHLGNPSLDYAILGEGNTSARADAETFWVKASGNEMRTITASGFVQVSFKRVLALLDRTNLSDQEVKDGLTAAKINPNVTAHPSVETLLHALCLGLEGMDFVGHTHPVAINTLTCSNAFETAFSGRLFPDEIVVCGPAPLLVPYTDPGLPLARYVKRLLDVHANRYGEPPRVVILQNHGMIALGRSITQVENITAMMVKTARVLLGTFAAGGPRFMPPAEVERIHGRPDEHYRRKQLGIS
jgi:rhamnose utilization protein RhaD (predicted bifunctional aldolase and dehydrogenase)